MFPIQTIEVLKKPKAIRLFSKAFYFFFLELTTNKSGLTAFKRATFVGFAWILKDPHSCLLFTFDLKWLDRQFVQ